MSEEKPIWMQNLMQPPEALWAQWQEGQQQTLDYLSQLITLGTQSYQDVWRLNTDWMRELSVPPKAGNGALSTDNAMDYAKRAQQLVTDQLEELEKLNSDWWTNINKATMQALGEKKGATRRAQSDKRKTTAGAADSA